MKEIKEIVGLIHSELDSAEEAAKFATKYKGMDRPLADMYYAVSNTHLDNIKKLHDQVMRLIQDQKAKNVEIPDSMYAVWDWEHEKMVDVEAKIKALLTLYREN